MRTALGGSAGGEYDRLTVLALALLFQPTTHALGRGMIIECYEGKRSKGNATTTEATNALVAGAAVESLSPHHAEKLWGAVPGTAQLGLLEQILLYALMNEDGGWARAARDRIDTLRRHDKLGASNARVGRLCADVCQALRRFWGEALPVNMVRATSWQRGGAWMAESIVMGCLDGGTPPATLSHTDTLDHAEWVLASLAAPQLDLDLTGAMALATLDVPRYPYLAAAGAHIRREHLGRGVNPTERGAGCEPPDTARAL
jgi:hypothetical protein